MRGHIRKRGTGYTVVVDVGRDEHGHRKQKWHSGFATRKEAQQALAEIISRLSAGSYVQPSKQTVTQYLEEWLESIRATVRPSTWASYKATLENHIIPRVGGISLQGLRAATLNATYAELLSGGRRDGKGGLSPRSVRYAHTIIRRALADAVRWSRLPRNVADQANPPRGRVATEMSTWTAPEVRVFLEHTQSDRLSAAWRLAVATGMRRGEILGLRWRDLDLEGRRLAVQQTLISVGYEVLLSEPKTVRGKRSVALDGATVAALREHRKRQLEEHVAWGPAYQDAGLVFCREDGSPIHPERLSKMFEQHAKAAGLPRIRLHDLRHTHASLALAAGVHPKVVSERLGHTSISITLDTYSHAIPALQEEAADTVAALLGG